MSVCESYDTPSRSIPRVAGTQEPPAATIAAGTLRGALAQAQE